jgi:hypothetical protein
MARMLTPSRGDQISCISRLVQIANGSPVAVCFECATGLRPGVTSQGKVEPRRLDPPAATRAAVRPRSSPRRDAPPVAPPGPESAPAADAAKRICIECRRSLPSGKKRICSSCRRRKRVKRKRELAKLHGQELAKAHKNKKKAKGDRCFAARQVRARIVQGGLPSLGKRG